MARKPRDDTPGSWHHVMNRAIARRPIYETREDMRFFLAGVARAVRRGQLEVHAWCVLTTHFHMLVRSPIGEMSNAMHRIQNAYSRYFNRKRRRDGPLLRGRFRSKPVKSLVYRRMLVRYIDANPVVAGLARNPCEYAWGSARQYASNCAPRWLQREWVEETVAGEAGLLRFDPRVYPCATADSSHERIVSLVDSQLEANGRDEELDLLLEMTQPAVRGWLRRKAAVADGPQASSAYVTVAAVSAAIATCTRDLGDWVIRPSRKEANGWSTLHAGLLRDLAGASFVVVASCLHLSGMQAKRLVERHRNLLRADDSYGDRAAMLASKLLDAYRGLDRLAVVARSALQAGE